MDSPAAPLRTRAALLLLLLLAPATGLAQHANLSANPSAADRSLIFLPLSEEQSEQSLDLFRTGLTGEAAQRLFDIELDQREEYGRAEERLTLDLFRSLGAYLHGSNMEAQALAAGAVSSATVASPTQSRAALLSALESYAHRPLRRPDIAAGLNQLNGITDYASSAADITTEVEFWRAEGLRALGEFAQSENAYRRAITASSDSRMIGFSSFRLAELQERQGNATGADSNFALAANIRQSPILLLALLRQAAEQRRSGHLLTALTTLDQADSLYTVTEHRSPSFNRDLGYVSPLIQEMMLIRTPHDRMLGSTRLPEGSGAYATQLASNYYRSEVALVRGSTLSGLARYDDATQVLRDAELSIDSMSQFQRSSEEAKFVANAIRFERAWSLFERAKYKEAASAFLELAVIDTSTSGQSMLRGATSTLRERGEFFDPFLNDSVSLSRAATLSTSALGGTTLDTASFFYNDFPERARYYAGVALARAGMSSEASDVLEKLALNKTMLYSDLAAYQLALIRFGEHSYEAAKLLEPVTSEQTVRGAYASLLLGELSYRRGMYERADAYFLNAYANIPQDDTAARAAAHLERGLSLIPLGAWHDAADELHTYLRLTNERVAGRTDEALFWLGKAYLRDGQYDSALTTYSRLLADFPNSARKVDAQYGYAWSLFEANDYAHAATAFQSVIALDSISRFSYDVLARAGDSYYALGNFADANRLYNLAVDRPAFNDFRTTRALLMLGVTRYRMDSARSAMNIFAYLATRYPRSDIIDEAHFDRALAAYSINQTAEAERDVQVILAQYHQSALAPRALYVAGEERSRHEDLRSAITYYQDLLRDYPRSREAGDALIALQNALLTLKRPGEAIAVADTFMARNPETPLGPELMLRSGEISLRVGEAAHSTQLLESFISKYPMHSLRPRADLLLARASLLGKDTARALSQLATIIAQYDSLGIASEAYLDRARIERKENLLAQAATDYQAAFADRYYSNDAAPQAMVEYAEMLTDQKKPDSAIAVFRNLSYRYPIEASVSARAAIRAGELLAAKGTVTEARMEFTRVTTAHPKDVWGGAAAVRIGESYLTLNDYRSAVTALQSAKKDFPLSYESEARRLLALGESELALGRKSAAAEPLRQLLRTPGASSRQRASAESLLKQIAPAKIAKNAKKGKAR